MSTTVKKVGRGRGSATRNVSSTLSSLGAGHGTSVTRSTLPKPGRSDAPVREMLWDDEMIEAGKKELVPLARRPSFAASHGNPIPVRINFFEIRFTLSGLIQIYEVAFQTVRESKPLLPEQKRAVVWSWLKEYLEEQKSFKESAPHFAYDGTKYLFSTESLNLDGRQVSLDKGSRISIKLPGEVGTTTFTMRIKSIGSVDMIPGKNPGDVLIQGYSATGLTLIDAVIRQFPYNPILQSDFITVGNNFYKIPNADGLPSINLSADRYSLYGVSVNTRLGLDGKPYINVDNANSVFFKPISCLEFMVNALNEEENTTNYLVTALQPDTELEFKHTEAIRKHIKGLKVDMCYFSEKEKYKNRTRTVTKVGDAASRTTFVQGEGDNKRTVSVVEYLKERRGITLKYPNLPVLVFGTGTNTSCVPIELCSIAPYQRSVKSLPEGATAMMIKQLCTTAPNRVNNIMSVINQSKLGNDPWSKSFGVERNEQMTKIDARVLQAPRLLHGNNSFQQPERGVWAGRTPQPPMLSPSEISGVIVVKVGLTQRDLTNEDALKAVDQLYKVGRGVGFRVPSPNEVGRTPILDVGRSEFEYNFKTNVRSTLQQYNPSLVIVLFSGRNSQQYGIVKRVCECEFGIASQCLLVKNCKPFLKPMTAFNVLLKVNVKLAGCNWQIANDPSVKPIMDELSKQMAMVIGMDVSHPGGRDQRVPSLAAMVGSLDEHMARYGASVKINDSGVETIHYIQNALIERIEQFYNVTNQHPKSIIIYRDGVASNMFQEIMREEFQGIRDALDNGGLRETKLTFIVCHKRHHVRLFCENSKDYTGKGQNVPAGTIVDRDVVDSDLFDYYLCSHAGIQGTSRPCHYTVLHDDNNYSAELLERLSFHLCHLYARCTRSVSIPAPVYYADKVAERAKYHLLEFLSKLQGSVSSSSENSSAKKERLESMTRLTRVTDTMKKTMYFC